MTQYKNIALGRLQTTSALLYVGGMALHDDDCSWSFILREAAIAVVGNASIHRA